MSEHYITKCSCGAIINQCRCMSCNKTERKIQDGCQECLYKKLNESKIEEQTYSSDAAGSDGNFDKTGVRKDDYMMSLQNLRPKKTMKDFPKMIDCDIPKEHRGFPCFDVENEGEFNSFQKGIKRFHLWRQHTTSADVKSFARENPNKDFYLHHAGRFMLIDRSRKPRGKKK